MKSILSTFCLLMIFTPFFGQKVKKYLNEGKIEKAIKYCKKRGAQNTENCFMLIANYHFDKGDIQNAVKYYQKSNEPSIGFLKVAQMYLNNEKYNKAEDLYLKAGESPKNINNIIADHTFSNKQYDKAAELYYKAENNVGLEKVADMYLSNQEYDIAVNLYLKLGESRNLVYNKVADYAFKNNMYNQAADLYEKADNKEGLNKIAEYAFENKKYKTALIIYTKLSNIDKIAVCKELFKTIKMKTGFWSGEGISFIISEEGTEIDSLKVKVYNSLNGYIYYKINRTIPIVQRDYRNEIFFNGKADSPPFPIEISGEFLDNLDEINITATTFSSSYFHQTGKTIIRKYPTDLVAKHKSIKLYP